MWSGAQEEELDTVAFTLAFPEGWGARQRFRPEDGNSEKGIGEKIIVLD